MGFLTQDLKSAPSLEPKLDFLKSLEPTSVLLPGGEADHRPQGRRLARPELLELHPGSFMEHEEVVHARGRPRQHLQDDLHQLRHRFRVSSI